MNLYIYHINIKCSINYEQYYVRPILPLFPIPMLSDLFTVRKGLQEIKTYQTEILAV
jgi:hypothetical protein